MISKGDFFCLKHFESREHGGRLEIVTLNFQIKWPCQISQEKYLHDNDFGKNNFGL